MIKFVESSVTFTEVPDEISLCLNLSLCPNCCPDCSESYLAGDIGEELTEDLLNSLISQYPGITCVCFMGGDNDHNRIAELTAYIHQTYSDIKVAMYSGQDKINLGLAAILDYYKIGGWRMFVGPEDTWKNQTAGPICLPTSNQKMYMRNGNTLVDITDKFRKNKINNWKSVII